MDENLQRGLLAAVVLAVVMIAAVAGSSLILENVDQPVAQVAPPVEESDVSDELELLQALRYTDALICVVTDSEFRKSLDGLLSVQVERQERECDSMQNIVANHVNVLGYFMSPLWAINIQNIFPECPVVYGALKSLWGRYDSFDTVLQVELCYLTRTLTHQFDPLRTPGGVEFLRARVVLGECTDYNYGSSGYEVRAVDFD